MHRFLKSMTEIIATSPQYLASSPVLQHYQHKTQVIPLGIDRASFPKLSTERVNEWRARVITSGTSGIFPEGCDASSPHG